VKREQPGPGQESVWDYPRPPRLERFTGTIRIDLGGRTIAETDGAYRVLETSHPPVYYLPPQDIADGALVPAGGGSLCEWKGRAAYFDVVSGDVRRERAAWSYPRPTSAFAAMADYVAFYAGPMDACIVDGERVTPQPGGFYGGWITSNILGPFKGGPGTIGW
jgi:uncharacterized protein (DUF427 family)